MMMMMMMMMMSSWLKVGSHRMRCGICRAALQYNAKQPV